jgi:hypothetical protein
LEGLLYQTCLGSVRNSLIGTLGSSIDQLLSIIGLRRTVVQGILCRTRWDKLLSIIGLRRTVVQGSLHESNSLKGLVE